MERQVKDDEEDDGEDDAVICHGLPDIFTNDAMWLIKLDDTQKEKIERLQHIRIGCKRNNNANNPTPHPVDYFFTGIKMSFFDNSNTFHDKLNEIWAFELSYTATQFVMIFRNSHESRSTSGDSGAPLYLLLNNGKIAVGLLSTKDKIGGTFYMNFLNICFYRTWIHRKSGIYAHGIL